MIRKNFRQFGVIVRGGGLNVSRAISVAGQSGLIPLYRSGFIELWGDPKRR